MSIEQLDKIMLVMDEAFDPQFGEAWTRRQIADALARPGHFCLLGHADAGAGKPGEALGFAISRKVLDEEELLLLAVRPHVQRRGMGAQLLGRLANEARNRGTTRLFLETRDGNPAMKLYEKFGFAMIGRRKGYYRSAANGPIDALTYSFSL